MLLVPVMRAECPIGVFDSGLGGLTVLKALRNALPAEDFLYLGDVARLPYGTKSQAMVERYALQCLRFLVKRQVKLVVVACNTATATALSSLRQKFEPLYGVIGASVRAALQLNVGKRFLVLGTQSTIHSEAYPKEFRRQRADSQVRTIACPLLVPLAEEGWFDHPVSAEVINRYLSQVPRSSYDAVVLGCTHYPLLRPSFERVLGKETPLVDSGWILAEEVRQSLSQRALLNNRSGLGTIQFCGTDRVGQGLPIVKTLFGERAGFELVDLSND